MVVRCGRGKPSASVIIVVVIQSSPGARRFSVNFPPPRTHRTIEPWHYLSHSPSLTHSTPSTRLTDRLSATPFPSHSRARSHAPCPFLCSFRSPTSAFRSGVTIIFPSSYADRFRLPDTGVLFARLAIVFIRLTDAGCSRFYRHTSVELQQ